MVTTLDRVPTQCATAADRAAREAATRELLERRAASTDDEERQQLLEEVVELNIEMARGIARRFRGRGAEADDLEQVAYLGLVKAAHHYRLDADTPFIGFAIPTIRGEVKRYFRDCAWTVRIPRRLQEMQGTIAAKLPYLEQLLNREPTPAEIADHLGVELSEVEQALAAKGCFNVLSLDRPAEADADLTLADVVADDDDATIDQLEAVDMLQPVLADLGERERRILQLRFVEGWTQSEIGADIGVSQMQVSRVLRRILDDLRDKLSPVPAAA
ncbi:RNA polymerase, sigma 28 subunit, FliA/WhiG subfamily [Kribbella flavida DSM 17836]|uniref:RNA polymerase, sigma 28 subunit, FliA/WhiG subfamily n=1 Tax=Kribbella flavida (strain DSM 17836 / JCM 10339 / NBRC 14399) TaxID=479435 RepID=D2PPQ2_KRIFD|nr:SigB/SigF/SigG family RNA polymerase sigma factor [Kribbella flavida]ADB31014.1 RNA polymerase, sigma 28 subunit, FliA/WhiG subfamily [Kribbella flavida DSM 17836]